MLGLGFGELVLIFLIALIFIGPKKLPELAKGLGQGIKEFQKAAKGFNDQLQDSANEEKKKEEDPKVITDAPQHKDDSSNDTAPADKDNRPS